MNANQTDGDGRTALMRAVLAGRDDLLPTFFEYATEAKIDFNHRDINGHNVLLMPTIEHDTDGFQEYYYESGALDLLLQNVRRFGIGKVQL